MRILQAPTENFVKLETTKLSNDITAGSSISILVESSDGFSDNDFVVIGYEGSELAELQQINATVSSNTAFQVATLKFNHKKGEPVTRYRYNQRKFYGSTTENGSYTELTGDGSPKTIQVDDPQGTILEYSGSTYEYFKATYYNSETSEETNIDDSTGTEADESKRYATLWQIRKSAGLVNNPYYTDARIEEKRKQAEGEINSLLLQKYVLPLAEVPSLINYICELLASGYIIYEEFPNNDSGKKMLGEARSLLKQISSGKQLLIGSDYLELTQQSRGGKMVSSYPNATVSDTDENAKIFKISQKF